MANVHRINGLTLRAKISSEVYFLAMTDDLISTYLFTFRVAIGLDPPQFNPRSEAS